MKFIIIGAKAYKELVGRIEKIEQTVAREKPQTATSDDDWVDGDTVCRYLGISPRTLQRLRSDDLLFGVEPQILLHVGRNQTGIAGSLRKSK